MALVRPGQTPPPAGTVPEVPDEVPRHKGDGRPWIRHPSNASVVPTKEGDYYTRASSLGDCVEDVWAIQRSRERRIVFGMSRSAGLYDRATAVRELDERAELDEVVALAVARSGGDDAAMSGTAYHLLTEREDAGEDLSYLGERMTAAVAAWRRLMERFVIHATETFVVHDEYRTAGTFDRLVSPLGWMRAPDGTRIGPDDRLIMDIKSGKDAEKFGAKYKVQQAVYAGGVPYSHREGRYSWPGPAVAPPPHQGWALIPHVPLDHPEDAGLYWVDLTEGRELAELALAVRKVWRTKGLAPAELPSAEEVLVPADELAARREAEVYTAGDLCVRGCGDDSVHVVGACRATGPWGLLESIAVAPDRPALEQLYDEHAAAWADRYTEAVHARLAELGGVAS